MLEAIEVSLHHTIGPRITEPIWTDRLFDEGVKYFTRKIEEGLKKVNEIVVTIYGYPSSMRVIYCIRELVHPAIATVICMG